MLSDESMTRPRSRARLHSGGVGGGGVAIDDDDSASGGGVDEKLGVGSIVLQLKLHVVTTAVEVAVRV